jgi:hypothetical protein
MGRFADVIMSVPSLIFALLMLSIFGTNDPTVIVIGRRRDHLLAARLPPDPGGRRQHRGDGLHRGGEAARRGTGT